MRLSIPVLIVVLSGCFTGGCFGNTTYTGMRYPPIARASEVEERAKLPSDHRVIGRAMARCKTYDRAEELDEIMFSDGLCTKRDLQQRLREVAAEVGGDLLVDRDCDAETSTIKRKKTKNGREKEVTIKRTDFACSADVARPINACRKVCTVAKARGKSSTAASPQP